MMQPKAEPIFKAENEEQRDWSQFEAPERVSSNPIKAADNVDVQTNLFVIDIKRMKKVYKYRIEMIKCNEDDTKEKELTIGQRNDFAVQARRRVTMSLFHDLIAYTAKLGTPLSSEKFGVVYDCGNFFYTVKPLTCPMNFVLEGGDISSSNTKTHMGNKFTKVRINIQAVGEIEPCNTNVDNRELIQFTELLTSAHVNRQQDHFVFKNRTYCRSSRDDTDLREGKVVKPGNQKNCRVVDQDGSTLMLQLDAKKSPFFESCRLIDFCKKFNNLQRVEDLARLSSRDFKKLNVQLKDLWVRTSFKGMKVHQVFPITKLDTATADTKFVEFDGLNINVTEYYLRKYCAQLQYPFLPLVVQKKGNKLLSFPMEYLDIERGQRVVTNKSTPSMVEKMIRECQLKPINLMEHIDGQMKAMSLVPDADNKYLQTFGVTIRGRPEIVPARVLHPPAIMYKSKMVEPTRDGVMNWKLGSDHFFSTAELKDPWMFIIFDRCVHDNQTRDFVNALARRAAGMNMTIDSRKMTVISLPSERDDLIDKAFQEAKQNKMRYIFAVTSQKLDPVHNTLKYLEARYSIVTQHVSKQTFQKALSNQGNFMVLGNLVSKTNPKLGGVNHTFDVSKAYKSSNPQDSNAIERLFNKKRMFIGIDVSHAGPQSFADRQLGVVASEPTVVGMSYSVGVPTQMRGMFWFQEPRLATISRLAQYGINSLQDFCKVTKGYPDDIIIFRSGASEGEYGKVEEEMKEFCQCFAEISRISGRPYNPSITTIVCQTSSNYRMVPTKINPRDRPCDQNVKPGTCVDTDIVNPCLDEFILIPQKAIQGTARVIKCTVVHRRSGSTGKSLPIADLENITNMLTYGHQTVAGSTGVPCHVYAAANLAKRGRNNWKTANFMDCDGMSEASGSSNGKLKHDGSPDFFEKLTQQLSSDIKTHYWA